MSPECHLGEYDVDGDGAGEDHVAEEEEEEGRCPCGVERDVEERCGADERDEKQHVGVDAAEEPAAGHDADRTCEDEECDDERTLLVSVVLVVEVDGEEVFETNECDGAEGGDDEEHSERQEMRACDLPEGFLRCVVLVELASGCDGEVEVFLEFEYFRCDECEKESREHLPREEIESVAVRYEEEEERSECSADVAAGEEDGDSESSAFGCERACIGCRLRVEGGDTCPADG